MAVLAQTQPRFRAAGALLAVGCVVFVIGVALYVLLPRELGAPADAAAYVDAQREATNLGSEMQRAGRVIFLGDLLIAASALALLPRRRQPASDIERVGWALIFVSFVPAFVFDSLFGSALPLLAAAPSDVFAAFKAWFDLQFAMGNIPFGVGATAVFVADARSAQSTLPAVIDYLGVLFCAMALIGGLGFVLGVFVNPTLTGGALAPAALVFGVLGLQIAREA